MAILYRTNAQSAAFEEALGKADIPYRVRGIGRFLDRPEVKVALADLRSAVKRDPSAPFIASLHALASDASTTEERGEERREHVDAIVRLGHEYLDADGNHATLDGVLAYLTATLRDETPASSDAVALLPVHRAKGLEFTAAFVTGLERGLVPISHAETTEQKAEERRLLYVALTRAERALHLSLARTRTSGARVMNRARSPWLAPIEASWRGPNAAPAGDPRAGIRATRGRLAAAQAKPDAPVSPADAELFAALADWRKRLARASAVPAFVIFSDATLRAIAAARPTTRVGLLDVHGIGPVKAERHGDAVLEIVGQHPVARHADASAL
jgi:DNA helicase-2/ATP-dependent DNA helicase PcrA